jgi:hypothetical protein
VERIVSTPIQISVIGTSPVTATLPSITLHPAAAGADLPYLATLYPLEGTVAASERVVSPDDARLVGSTIATWPDGSARIVVLAGTMTVGTRPLPIRLGKTTAPHGPALTARAISALVSNITVNLPGAGSGSLTGFASPAKVWWANERVICARYYIPLAAGMVAAVDIHAFASRALVEITVENGVLDPAAPVTPATKAFSRGTVSINGAAIASDLASPVAGATPLGGDGLNGGHTTWEHTGMTAMRAFSVTHWIGGDPQIEVTHDKAFLAAHPVFWKSARDASESILAGHGTAAYRVWHMGLLPAGDGGSSSNRPGIGVMNRFDVDYMRSGDKRARRSVLANARAHLHYPINYRNASNYNVLHAGSAASGGYSASLPINKGQRGFGAANDPAPELAHHASFNVIPFLCHPSPMFIEGAQKLAIYFVRYVNGWYQSGQVRGRAWAMRTWAHALWLTPDADAWWKAPMWANVFIRSLRHADNHRPASGNCPIANPLDIVWASDPGSLSPPMAPKVSDFTPQYQGVGQSLWEHDYYSMVMWQIAQMKLASGADQALIEAHADWTLGNAARRVNECKNGEWRWKPHTTVCGTYAAPATQSNGAAYPDDAVIEGYPRLDSLPTWGEQLNWFMSRDGSRPPASAGWWIQPKGLTWGTADAVAVQMTTSGGYHAMFMGALACAVDRHVPGSHAAWARIANPATGLPDIEWYYDGAVNRPDFAMWPRVPIDPRAS